MPIKQSLSDEHAVPHAPVDVSQELRERLWDEGPTAILVSATLTAGEDARFVRRRLGLDRARELVVGSPYDFGEQALLYLPRAMPDPRNDGFTDRVASEIVSLLALSEGRALATRASSLSRFMSSVLGGGARPVDARVVDHAALAAGARLAFHARSSLRRHAHRPGVR